MANEALAEELVRLRLTLRIGQVRLADAFEGMPTIDVFNAQQAQRAYGGLEVAIDALGRMIDRDRGELTLSTLPGLVLTQLSQPLGD